MKRIPATSKRAKEAWKHIPLVKLGEILKKMIWFTGEYNLNRLKSDYESMSHTAIPNSACLDIQYREQQITIECIWETRESPSYSEQDCPDRFAIGILEPKHYDFQTYTRRWPSSDIIKHRHSRFYSNAIDKIEDAIYDAQEVIDNEIAEKEEREREVREMNFVKEKLCKSFDVKITSECMELFYREHDDYCFHFALLKNGLYKINRIGGEYTEDEIKKIIELVGGNPRAIAERLTK